MDWRAVMNDRPLDTAHHTLKIRRSWEGGSLHIGSPRPSRQGGSHFAWVPAVKNDGRFGRWGFVEIKDPHDTMKAILVQ